MMKSAKIRLLLTAVIILFMSANMAAQSDFVDISGLDLDAVDFSEARLSIAGPGAFLIRAVQLDGESFSVIFREIDGAWVVAELIPESEAPLLPRNVVLDFATVEVTESGLRIDGIIIDGRAYSTTLTISDDRISASETLSAAKLVGASLGRVRDDAGLYSTDDLTVYSGQIAELSQRNSELVSQVGSLTGYVEDLRSENSRLDGQVQQLQEEKAALDAEVAELVVQIDELTQAQLLAETALSAAQLQVTEAQSQAAEAQAEAEQAVETITEEELQAESAETELLRQRISSLLERIALLEERIESLQTDLALAREQNQSSAATASENSAAVASATSPEVAAQLVRLTELENLVVELRIENARLSGERSQIEQEVRSKLLSEGFIASMLADLTEVRQSGFGESDIQLGSWELYNGVMSQTDASQFFAKLDLPVIQDSRPTLYSFEGRSRGAGWTGFGVHIFADNVNRRGYGYGESLLVWFTRDPDNYGDDRTYLELYRSSDDINMARVLSAAITEDISEWMDVDLLYQPGDEYITIAVNGEEKVRYKTWFGIDWGVQMALRTLDTAQFRRLEVVSTPGEITWPEND